MAKRIYAQGGLGNQLFIWRAAHHLHAISNEPVQVVYPNGVSSHRHLELKHLLRHCSHSISIKEPKELNKKVKFAQKYPSLNHRIAKMLPPNFRVRVSSSPILGIETLGSKGSDFLGFFQNAKSEKLEIFSPYQEINDVIEEQWQKLRYIQKLSKKEDFQVLHVRRGDYELLKNEYGLLSHRYFSKNLDPSLETIICTDSENLSTNFLSQFKNCLVLTPKDLDSWQTLTLMVGSKYFIGANSTLSWWAARLRVENGLESVLPDPWFKIGDLENNFLTPGITFSRSEFEE
jgi:hypothetical protein